MAASSTYVLYVGAGREASTEKLLRKTLRGGGFSELFFPRYEKKLKQGGAWRTVEVPWVPGYLFVVTADIDALRVTLRTVPAITRVLGMGAEVVPLSTDEALWLDRFAHPGERVVGFSEGYIEGDRVVVTSGPLAGYESLIVKIDRHKRIAWLGLSLADQSRRIKVGLEIVSKVAEVLPKAA